MLGRQITAGPVMLHGLMHHFVPGT